MRLETPISTVEIQPFAGGIQPTVHNPVFIVGMEKSCEEWVNSFDTSRRAWQKIFIFI